MTRGRIGRARSPLGLLLAGLVVLLFVAVLSTVGESAAEIGEGWVPGVADTQREGPEIGEDLDPFEGVQTPPALRAFLAVLFMVVLLVIGVLVVFGLIVVIIGFHTARARKPGRGETSFSELPDEAEDADIVLVSRAATKARDRLVDREAAEPGDDVVRAWLVLEQATADAGLRREPHQTPTEFTSGVLAGLQVDAAALDRLRGLYQRARFSSRRVTAADATAAREALDRVVDDLAARAGAPA